MRLDHIAYRVKDRYKTAQFFIDCLEYKIPDDLPDGFQLKFDDGTTAKCLVLIPSIKNLNNTPWNTTSPDGQTYHMAPEIFISDGSDGSIVSEWVEARDGVGGVHHMAYQVEDVAAKMAEWTEKGYAEFLSEKPLTCPGLEQVFTKPSKITGIIYELIRRETNGFCAENVKDLMNSTKDNS
jgi:hypothetical protein